MAVNAELYQIRNRLRFRICITLTIEMLFWAIQLSISTLIQLYVGS